MTIFPIDFVLLRHIAKCDYLDLRRVTDFQRQKLINLGMEEPALVDVDADRVVLTRAGKALLEKHPCL